ADGRSFGGFETLIWAVGRVPRTSSLALDRARVEIDAGDAVVVDGYQNTSAERIYAIGDVTGRALLTPVAIAARRRPPGSAGGGPGGTGGHPRPVGGGWCSPTRRSAPSACPRRRRASATRVNRSRSTRPSSSRCSSRSAT